MLIVFYNPSYVLTRMIEQLEPLQNISKEGGLFLHKKFFYFKLFPEDFILQKLNNIISIFGPYENNTNVK